MEPTSSEIASLSLDLSVAALGTWAGWPETDTLAFLELVGHTPLTDMVLSDVAPMHPRLLCMYSGQEIATLLDGWQIGGANIRPIMRMTAELVFRAARSVLGQTSVAEQQVAVRSAEQQQDVVDQTMSQVKTLMLAEGMSKADCGGRKIKASTLVDPLDDTEIMAASAEQVKTWYSNYKASKFGEPLPEREPTPDQISAMHTRIVKLCLEPYADFSILTPHGRRMAKVLRHRSWIFQEDGTYKPIDVPGPDCYEQGSLVGMSSR